MLVKNEKKFYDAHFHYSDCIEQQCISNSSILNWTGCSCAHSIEEWNVQYEAYKNNNNLVLSYGLHPQSAAFIDVNQNLSFLENLLNENKVKIIGETGFDFYTADLKNTSTRQIEMFISQIELAGKFQCPVVIHCRKANEKLFEYSASLKKLPAVLFHSFMGSPVEAQSLLNKGINGYFSFGKQMMNNNKKVIACIKELPLERLLCETDAPFQYLKNESKTYVDEIEKIYNSFIQLRNQKSEDCFNQLEVNFKNLFHYV